MLKEIPNWLLMFGAIHFVASIGDSQGATNGAAQPVFSIPPGPQSLPSHSDRSSNPGEHALGPPGTQQTRSDGRIAGELIPLVEQLPTTMTAEAVEFRNSRDLAGIAPNPVLISHAELGVVFSAHAGDGVRGLTIVEVKFNSLAEALGLRVGDTLLSLELIPLNTPEIITDVLRKNELLGALTLRVRRGSRYHSVRIRDDERRAAVALRPAPSSVR